MPPPEKYAPSSFTGLDIIKIIYVASPSNFTASPIPTMKIIILDNITVAVVIATEDIHM
jgi:hypothetical protein